MWKNRIDKAARIAIGGHIRPDGDCVGSCLAVYNYLRDYFPQVDVTVYLERPAEKFRYLRGFDQICTEVPGQFQTDLCICLDSGDREREKRSLRFIMSTSAKPMAAQRKPFTVCSIVSQLGTRT